MKVEEMYVKTLQAPQIRVFGAIQTPSSQIRSHSVVPQACVLIKATSKSQAQMQQISDVYDQEARSACMCALSICINMGEHSGSMIPTCCCCSSCVLTVMCVCVCVTLQGSHEP
ncbi:hypothetical protein ABBQ38_001781 [Trebouxia sp. C0009 RCD-2024]